MKENMSSKFKLHIDDEGADSQFQAELAELQINKLSRKVTRISIYILCLTAIMLAIAYLDIKKKIGNIQNTGSNQVQGLSENLESRFSSLSLQYAKLEDSMNKKFLSIEEKTAVLKKDLNQSEKFIQTVQANQKDKKEAEKKEIENIKSEIKRINEKFTAQFTEIISFADQTQKKIKKLQTDLSAFSSLKIDLKKLNLALENQQKNYQQKLTVLSNEFEDKIQSIQERIAAIQKLNEFIATPPPEPGKIIEQDLHRQP
ncbi:MAG: hypothetical protein JW786_00690 [Desulfobacterales bacterium]|nr:hypothetical protein [Desulfobacterales bacterium]